MERQENAKQSGKVAKTARKPKSKPAKDAALMDISVKRTAVGAAKTAGPISTEQRRQLIAEAAYFRAVSRGFAGGDAVADWLDAEREVDQSLSKAAD